MLDNKKVKEISQMIQDTNDSIIKNPPKEVRLIEAMKPFFDNEQAKRFDNTIEMLNKIHAIKKISDKMVPLQPYPFKAHQIPQAPVRPLVQPLSQPLVQPPIQSLAQSAPADSSVHIDGIYDLDLSCIDEKHSAAPQSNSMMMMMLLLGMKHF